MKKILISILIVLLVVLAYFAIFNGLSFGNMRILSVGEISQANDDLTTNIEQAKSLLQKDYTSKKEELSNSVSTLLEKKEEYFKLAKISSDKEISKANTEEKYLIEFLWTRIGRHATSKGVNLWLDVKTSDSGDPELKDLSITAKGYYVGIIDFVSALENDSKLNFKIDNFKMVQEGELLSATFTVRNIKIKTENTTEVATPQDNNTVDETTQGTESKLNQLTGTVDSALAPDNNNQ